ncbi:hypothetical protein SAMN05216271_0930 [Halopseudomonas sabulinigri]|uniref:Uncharacterized protein n=1 Tax=Halopseudomonas sabulinigri TaxID=472181 RepID=A0A1H1NMC6_9GAMM|nr:hypothetical protein [Halopseudomonas sabulinigri]SDS00201.1 hypothetical protein SAMN05216271_0930 [Halopseudomonas sabulinigri]
MKPTHYLAILVRIFSVLLILFALRQSSFLLGLMTGQLSGLTVSMAFAISSVVIPILVAIFLWYFPMKVAKTILKPEIDQPVEPMNAPSCLTVLLLAVATYYLYFAIIDAVYWATLWQMSERSQGAFAPLNLSQENKANMLSTIVELLVSAILILKARTISRKMLSLAA